MRSRQRLLVVMLITSGSIARAIVSPKWWAGGLLDVAAQASDWGRWLLTSANVHVHVHGEKPPCGVLLVCNHRSYIDIPVVMHLLPCAFLAKLSVAKWPVLGLAARMGNTVFVDRSSQESRREARAHLRSLLEDGLSVVIFPEGTTTAGPGIASFRPGAFAMAARGDFPVVPMAIHYEDPKDAWVGEETFVSHFLRTLGTPHKHVHVSFGPIMRDDNVEHLRDRAHAWVETELLRLYHEATPSWAHTPQEEVTQQEG